ncbi:AAA family ATPase [Amycolatopsis sp. SID8362]|uniref:AAA family ATPase n=1 Tax=Amycolatopsis sp. SID8362 TaxID=2690346 RepID=UPI00136E1C33|nr:AAA family ATPase [Amycolatopsis sp. SID8362]NBH04831.1 AAA domain-containing protein [Amycolatopsis sp. SID8362]NED41532.1 AAA domain-containing protein [Amycolatopsis sp. SID8362]
MSEDELPEPRPGWWVYSGTGVPVRGKEKPLPPPPPWREFDGGPLLDDVLVPPEDGEMKRRLGAASTESVPRADVHEVDMVNAAIYLRRPLLVTGRPGSGKSSLAFRIARELGLGRVLQWPITSHTTLKTGTYGYDAIGRAQAAGSRSAAAGNGTAEVAEPPIGEFVRLGELGTAFLPRRRPRVLLIDELDKSEADLPNDLLSLFEDGEFEIPELVRMARRTPVVEVFTADPDATAEIVGGRVRCHAFPIVVITSNGERDFPPAFLRRCLRYETKDPDVDQLAAMVTAHMLDPSDDHRSRIIAEFVSRSEAFGGLPVDKLLEAVYLATSGAYRENDTSWARLVDALWRQLNSLVP